MDTTAENRQVRMLIREVKYFNQYSLMSMTFYVRKNGKCQLHTVWAEKLERTFCSMSLAYFTEYKFQGECPKRNRTNPITGTWMLHDAIRHFPKIYTFPALEGGLNRRPSAFFIKIHFVSNTTILFEARFINDGNYNINLSGALATGTNITEEMWKRYVKLTQKLKIPTKNIENVYETV
uniref:Uncharacterized protein n=1 Tax=Mus musculus TaxID=10090 RepID=Q3UYE3_MOUSE|nr:unnamed protein product [Mus musculus]